jgi:hypothetical protein
MIVANGEDDYRITFSTPVHAVGVELFTNSTAVETITLTFADGSVLAFTDTDLETAPSSYPFVGFKSWKPVAAVDIDTTNGAVENEGILAIKVAEAYRVPVDIKPGSEQNTVNLGSNGKLPVAILSNEQFDATKVDPASIRLAGAPVALRGKGVPMVSTIDVNGDGLVDLFVHIMTDALNLKAGETSAVMTATTSDGTAIYGRDSVRIVPSAKK